MDSGASSLAISANSLTTVTCSRPRVGRAPTAIPAAARASLTPRGFPVAWPRCGGYVSSLRSG